MVNAVRRWKDGSKKMAKSDQSPERREEMIGMYESNIKMGKEILDKDRRRKMFYTKLERAEEEYYKEMDAKKEYMIKRRVRYAIKEIIEIGMLRNHVIAWEGWWE